MLESAYSNVSPWQSIDRVCSDHMKKFAEVCLYNQCIIFIAAATNYVNTNVLMMWQKTQTFTLKSVLLSL